MSKPSPSHRSAGRTSLLFRPIELYWANKSAIGLNRVYAESLARRDLARCALCHTSENWKNGLVCAAFAWTKQRAES